MMNLSTPSVDNASPDLSPAIYSPKDFLDYCIRHQILSGLIVHPSIAGRDAEQGTLALIATQVRQNAGYADHEAICFHVDAECECLYFVFIHNTVRGMAQGGTRMLKYGSMNDLFFDGLRLSKAMTEKNAVAEIWWGGGKSIICPLDILPEKGSEQRKRVFERFGGFVASLNGVYVAAEDMNTTPEDMLTILSQNRFVTCLPRNVGGSSNPSPWTALGVFRAMKAALQYKEGKKSLEGTTVLVQGLGNVGLILAKLCAENGASILGADQNPQALKLLLAEIPGARSIPNEQVYKTPCDIFAPCARGGVLDDAEVATMPCRYVIGAANNPLVNDAVHAEALHQRNILYLPDFFVNRMGIINCANEQYGYLEEDLQLASEKIYTDVLALLKEADSNQQTPYKIALARANNLSAQPHPIWGHRGKRIILMFLK